MNEDLQNLMSKSKTNQLDSDGLTTLKYKKIQEKNLPLYTWILVDLPKVTKTTATTHLNFTFLASQNVPGA